MERCIDVDRHVYEPYSFWEHYLPQRYGEFVPIVAEYSQNRGESVGNEPDKSVFAPLVGDQPIWKMSVDAYRVCGEEAKARADEMEAGASPDGHITDMNKRGIQTGVILPTMASYLVNNDTIDAELSRAYADAYNRWMLDFCSDHSDRLIGAAVISRHEPSHMVEDLELALKRGFRTVVIRPNPVQGRTLGSDEYDEFWQVCEDANLPVMIHEGAHSRVPTIGADRFASRFGQLICSHPLEAMTGLLSLIEGGVFTRRPKLRVAFMEAGISWLPYWMWRMDEIYEHMRNEVKDRVPRKPSEYVKENCWFTLEPTEPGLKQAIESLGVDRVLFGSDFPHLDHDSDILEHLLDQRASLGDSTLQSILSENPKKLLGLHS